jgi:alanyl-tRNA synthetase
VVTERLYYKDSYLTEFAAEVIDLAADGQRVYLDRTAFYPSSGGQPFDLGWLGGQEVIEVSDEGERIAHVTAAAIPAGTVTGQIHWPRRYDHMQQHTGQHLLSAVFVELCGFQTLSFHMGDEVSTIELGTKEIAEKQIEQAEDHANELARSGRPVRIGFEDAEQSAGLRKESQRSGTLRIVEIEGVDKSACGGTHVRSLAETLPLQIRKTEKVRGNIRLEFVCGWRATRRAKQDFKVAQELARQSATAIDKLPEHLAALRQRLSEAEKERQTLAQNLAQRQGRELYLATEPSADGLRRAFWQTAQIDDAVRAKALAFAAGAKSVALVIGAQPAGVLIACSPDAGIDAGAILKQALAEFGGRGGGSATLAQGNMPNELCVRALAQKLEMH